ncbi:MAG: phosphatidylserine decarboxylase family protein [FCB group bacterium]|nr:phosphatidylserine decarboxylase family protein [FCB group bacterium]
MIAREGLAFIFIGAVLTIGFIITAVRYDNKVLLVVSLVFAILTLFTTFFFRDPQRGFTPHDNLLLSPADGEIIAIEDIQNDSFVGGKAIKISIFLSVFDVHINRIPATGVIDYVKYNPGKFFPAYREKASLYNEQTEIGLTASAGQKLIVKQIAGIIARRIVCHLKKGENVTVGERFGLIKFGSRTELIIPADSKLLVKKGDHIYGGKTIVGYLSGVINSKEHNKNRGSNVEL